MIEIKSKLSSKELWELQKFAMRRMWWIYVIASILFTFVGLSFWGEEIADKVFSIVFMIVFGLGFFPLCLFFTSIMSKAMNKSKLISNETYTIFRFSFDSDILYHEIVKAEGYKGTIEVKYSLLHKVYETKTYFFIFISASQSYIVSKEGIEAHRLTELSEFLKKQLGAKYKVF